MPTYTFRDKNTLEQFDKFLSISAREEYLNQNPHIESVITAPAIGDSVRLGRGRDAGFKDVLQKIHQRTPGSDLKKMNVI
jgi:hypothetical protein